MIGDVTLPGRGESPETFLNCLGSIGSGRGSLGDRNLDGFALPERERLKRTKHAARVYGLNRCWHGMSSVSKVTPNRLQRNPAMPLYRAGRAQRQRRPWPSTAFGIGVNNHESTNTGGL